MSITRQKDRPVEPINWQYPYDPSRNPKQILFHSVKAKEKLFGGAASGGKSDALLAEVLGMVLRFGIKGLVLRRSTTDARELIERLLVRIPQPTVGKWNDQQKTWRFRNGGQLIIGYLEHDNDITRYVGSEFGIIAWDELTQFTEWQYRRMFHPLRIAKNHPGFEAMQAAGIEPYFIAATNPGSAGHAWVRARFVSPAPPGVVWQPKPTLEDPRPGTRVFIPARFTDNPYNSDDYINTLYQLPPDEQRMLIDGDWDVYAGQFFGEFRRDIHVIEPEQWPIPMGGVMKVAAVDYGLSNPFCCLWGAIFPDDMLVIYRELYEAELLASEQAKLILSSEARGERRPGREIPVYVDPSAWSREPTSPKPTSPHGPPRDSIAWHYAQAGLPIRRANNDRLSGWGEIKRRLRVQKDGRPRILIYNTCVNLIRTLPEQARSKTNPEDVDTHGEDHAADAARYLVQAVRRTGPHESTVKDELRRIGQAKAMTAGMLDTMRT